MLREGIYANYTMRYRRVRMSAIGDQRTSGAFPPLTMLLVLVWLAGLAASAPANRLAERAAAATPARGRAVVVWQHGRLGGPVNRRGMRGCYGPVLVGMPTGALGIVLLLVAGTRSAAAARLRTRPARVGARAPPLLRLA